MDTEQTNFYYEFQNYKDSNENQIRDIVVRMMMEKMVNTLETYEVDVRTIANRDKTLNAKVNLVERAAKRPSALPASKGNTEAELHEMLDRKIEKVYERVRNDNWIIWKESIRLAEREFTEGGIQKTIDLLPKVTYDRNDLKRTISTLMYDDSEQMPRPVISTGPIKQPSKSPKTNKNANLNSSISSSKAPKPGSPQKSVGKDTISKADISKSNLSKADISNNESLGGRTPKSGFEESKDYSR
mmetsp:Transcript_33777/g.33271  ORF Transcript_33777/g.33271 Transcript_33777/m.33271 type:complete len:243 (+) Transcript_33777:935-1663(+)